MGQRGHLHFFDSDLNAMCFIRWVGLGHGTAGTFVLVWLSGVGPALLDEIIGAGDMVGCS